MNEIEYPGDSHCAVCLGNCVVMYGGVWLPDHGELLQPVSTRVIWVYNLYTDEWSNHVIPDTSDAPVPFQRAAAAAIDGTIYTFGGMHVDFSDYNRLWKLSRTKTGGFSWSFIETKCKKKSPSPRSGHTAWDFLGKLWIFGGHCYWWFLHESPQDYLNDHGAYERLNNQLSTRNNQLLWYDPSSQSWTNPQCFGAVPSPRHGHDSTIIRNTLWLFGGKSTSGHHNDIFELNMHSLTWTEIQTNEPSPRARRYCSLTAVTDDQLVLHGGKGNGGTMNDTWIMDLTSHLWRMYTSEKDHPRSYHQGSSGLNSSAIMFGVSKFCDTLEAYNHTFRVMLEPKCLQQLAMKIIHKHQDELPWKCLPVKLISRLGISMRVKTATLPSVSESLNS